MELTELVNLAKDCKGPGNWTSSSLIRVGGILAGKINGVQNLSGPEKLKLVQRILLQLLGEAENKEIAETGLSKEEIQAIHDRYDTLELTVADAVPASLELALKAARGSLDLKKIKPSTWVKLCSCFATGVVHQLASMNLISETHATQARRLLASATEKAAAAVAAVPAVPAVPEAPAVPVVPAVPVPETQAKEEPTSKEPEPVEEKKESVLSEAVPPSEGTTQ